MQFRVWNPASGGDGTAYLSGVVLHVRAPYGHDGITRWYVRGEMVPLYTALDADLMEAQAAT